MLVERPACLGQQDVDEQPPGVGLGVVVVVGLRLRSLSGGDLRLEDDDLNVPGRGEFVLLGQRLRVRLACASNLAASCSSSCRDSGASFAASAGSNCFPVGTACGFVEYRNAANTTTWNCSRSTCSAVCGWIGLPSCAAVLPTRRIRLSFCAIPTPTVALKAGSLIRATRSFWYGAASPVTS